MRDEKDSPRAMEGDKKGPIAMYSERPNGEAGGPRSDLSSALYPESANP